VLDPKHLLAEAALTKEDDPKIEIAALDDMGMQPQTIIIVRSALICRMLGNTETKLAQAWYKTRPSRQGLDCYC